MLNQYRPNRRYAVVGAQLAQAGLPRAAIRAVGRYMRERPPPPPAAEAARPNRAQRGKSRKTPRKSKAKKVDKAIRNLQRHDRASLGTCTTRNLYSGTLRSAVNAQAAGTTDFPLSVAVIEAQLANLKFFNPATPGTLTSASGVSGTYQRNMLFKSVSSKLCLRNNYQSDADVSLYLCACKDDTDLSAYTAWQNGITKGSNLSATSQIGQYPSDYNVFNDLYKIVKTHKMVLTPGQYFTTSNTVDNVEYDSSTVDAHNLTHQTEYKNFQWLIIVKGVISHDTSVATEQTLAQAGVDWQMSNTYVIEYNAGTNITFTIVSNTMDAAFTNGGVQSHQPVPDNISYSVA